MLLLITNNDDSFKVCTHLAASQVEGGVFTVVLHRQIRTSTANQHLWEKKQCQFLCL